MTRVRHLSRFAGAAVGALLLLFANWWCASGIAWSVGFHPDEFPVARWIDQVRDKGYIVERPYPGGWFELARIGLWFEERAARIEAASARHRVQDGAVHALSESSFRRPPPPPPRKPEHDIQWGRDFNVRLYAFTILSRIAASKASIRARAALHP